MIRDSGYFRPRLLIGGGTKISHFGHNLDQCAPKQREKKKERDRPPNFARGGNYVAASCRDAIIIGH